MFDLDPRDRDDERRELDVQWVELGRGPSSGRNNVLAVLSVLLKKAVEWDVIDRMPCTGEAATRRQDQGSLLRR